MSDSLFVCSIFDQACSESSGILHGWNWYSSKSGAFCNPSKRAASNNQVIFNRRDQSVFFVWGGGGGRLENYFRGELMVSGRTEGGLDTTNGHNLDFVSTLSWLQEGRSRARISSSSCFGCYNSYDGGKNRTGGKEKD